MNPVDELAEIREQQKILAAREKELRTIIINDENSRVGSNYIARVSIQSSVRTSWKELAVSLGATDIDIEKFSSVSVVEFVRLRRVRVREDVVKNINHVEMLDCLLREKLVILDVETTGLYPQNGDRIIQIALLPITIDQHGNISEGNAYSTYINPQGRKSHPEAQLIHKIEESALALAPAFGDVCDTILKLIEGRTLIIHNSDFDLGFLFCELDRLEYEPLINDTIDTLSLAKTLWPKSRCSLQYLAQKFKIDLEQGELHDALNDVRVLRALLPHFISKIKEGH